jgi:glucan biosynthesis protein C
VYEVQASAAISAPPKPARAYDLDWLRIAGTLAVFLYHSSMFFNEWGWHVQNVPTSHGFGGFSLLFGPWIMPLFFVLSGASTAYAFSFRSTGAFIGERAKRLGVPLLLGIFLWAPPQVYIERVTHGQFSGSFWQWFPHYFEGFYGITGPTANFAWMGLHHWYLLLLFLFSLLTLPLFRALQRPGARRFADGIAGAALRTPAVLLLLAVPAALLEVFLDYNAPLGTRAMGGWNMVTYLILFIYGYMLFANPTFKQAIRRWGPLALIVAAVTIAVGSIWYIVADFAPFGMTVPYIVSSLVRVLACWSSVLAAFYLADRYLRRNHPSLQYWGQAAMPFYILHQPVIVFIGFLIRQWDLPPIVKFAVLLPTAFALVMTVFHYGVRPFKPVRFVFGMK